METKKQIIDVLKEIKTIIIKIEIEENKDYLNS